MPENEPKTVALTFSTEKELETYERLKAAAEADERTLNKFIVRYLNGFGAEAE